MASFETFKLILVPETDKLAQDVDGVVHYTRLIQAVREYKAGAQFIDTPRLRVEYCTEKSVHQELERTPETVITCVRCRGVAG